MLDKMFSRRETIPNLELFRVTDSIAQEAVSRIAFPEKQFLETNFSSSRYPSK
jgi:hypothetical protein